MFKARTDVRESHRVIRIANQGKYFRCVKRKIRKIPISCVFRKASQDKLRPWLACEIRIRITHRKSRKSERAYNALYHKAEFCHALKSKASKGYMRENMTPQQPGWNLTNSNVAHKAKFLTHQKVHVEIQGPYLFCVTA